MEASRLSVQPHLSLIDWPLFASAWEGGNWQWRRLIKQSLPEMASVLINSKEAIKAEGVASPLALKSTGAPKHQFRYSSVGQLSAMPDY